MSEVIVEAEAEVHPTEDVEKVERAIRNIVSDPAIDRVKLVTGAIVLRAKAVGLDALANLRRLLKQERIRDAARAALASGVSGPTIRAYLNKQAAYANRVSFCEPYGESPLGPITLTITWKNPQEIIDWIAPRFQARFQARQASCSHR